MGCPTMSWNMSQQHHAFVQNNLEMKLLYKQKYRLQEYEAILLLYSAVARLQLMCCLRFWASAFQEEENQCKATKTRMNLCRQDWIN